MKKLVFILILVVLFLIYPVFAIETTLRQEYQPGETLTAEISGAFTKNIEASDILFYSDRLYTPMLYDLTKIQDTYYLYSVLPLKERNYTLIIKDAEYTELGKEIKQDLRFNFSVSGSPVLFTINPGFILTADNFNIKVKSNLKTITIETEFLEETNETEVKEGEEKNLEFQVSDITEFTIASLKLKTGDTEYEIPVFIFASEQEKPKEKGTFRFSKSFFNITVLKDRAFEFEITLINTLGKDLKNIKLSTDLDILTLEPEKIKLIEADDTEKIKVSVNSDKPGLAEGNITANSENYSDEIELLILTTENEGEFQEALNKSEIVERETCEEIGGKKCGEKTECDVDIIYAADGSCCEGNCKEISTGGITRTAAILTIVIILVLIVFFLYKKWKVKQKTSREVIEKKSKEYEERFKSRIGETRESLTRT